MTENRQAAGTLLERPKATRAGEGQAGFGPRTDPAAPVPQGTTPRADNRDRYRGSTMGHLEYEFRASAPGRTAA
jgi:hypothetical protein